MDDATRKLRRLLVERQTLRARLAASDRALQDALRTWSDRTPGHRGGIATEAGAGYLLRQAGLL
jgi:hypothetical protein